MADKEKQRCQKVIMELETRRNLILNVFKNVPINIAISDFSGPASDIPMAIIGKRRARKIGELRMGVVLFLKWSDIEEKKSIDTLVGNGVPRTTVEKIRALRDDVAKSIPLLRWYTELREERGMKESIPTTSNPFDQDVSLDDARWYFQTYEGVVKIDLIERYQGMRELEAHIKSADAQYFWLAYHYGLISFSMVPPNSKFVLRAISSGKWKVSSDLLKRGDLLGYLLGATNADIPELDGKSLAFIIDNTPEYVQLGEGKTRAAKRDLLDCISGSDSCCFSERSIRVLLKRDIIPKLPAHLEGVSTILGYFEKWGDDMSDKTVIDLMVRIIDLLRDLPQVGHWKWSTRIVDATFPRLRRIKTYTSETSKSSKVFERIIEAIKDLGAGKDVRAALVISNILHEIITKSELGRSVEWVMKAEEKRHLKNMEKQIQSLEAEWKSNLEKAVQKNDSKWKESILGLRKDSGEKSKKTRYESGSDPEDDLQEKECCDDDRSTLKNKYSKSSRGRKQYSPPKYPRSNLNMVGEYSEYMRSNRRH